MHVSIEYYTRASHRFKESEDRLQTTKSKKDASQGIKIKPVANSEHTRTSGEIARR